MNSGECSREDESVQYKQVRRVTWIGLAANIVLSAVKIGCGIVGRSQAIVADGVHSVSDTTTDLAVLIGVRYWSAPPDETCEPRFTSRVSTWA